MLSNSKDVGSSQECHVTSDPPLQPTTLHRPKGTECHVTSDHVTSDPWGFGVISFFG